MKMSFYKVVIFIAMSIFGATAYSLNLPTEASANADSYCKEEWTKRGVLDERMYRYCREQESEGYRDLVSLANKYKSQKWIQDAVDYSINEWTKRGVRQDRMVNHSLKQITEGYEDLMYMSKQPGWNNARYQKCLGEWGIQFNMVVYCYKQN